MLALSEYRQVDRRALTVDALSQQVPAAFADAPDATRTSKDYTFISTAQVVSALLEAGWIQRRIRASNCRQRIRILLPTLQGGTEQLPSQSHLADEVRSPEARRRWRCT